MLTDDKKIYSVIEINRAIRGLLEKQFGAIWIEGEISGFKHYPSGHMYFTLKDAQAQISCVMFAGRNRILPFKPQDGQHVLLKAKASLYEDRGNFQLIVDYMEEAGDGALKRAFELLKQRLSAEGLFHTQHKKSLPPLPGCIGLITSSKGAAIHDILITLQRRFPAIPVIIYPTLVQGTEAANTISHAIHIANQRQECDVLIVGRGGGSLEDLQAFNTEIVARAIFESRIPIISAVGHEVDVTIADFVADVRAATPTAAAELISPDRHRWLAEIIALREQFINNIYSLIQHKMQETDWLGKRLKHPGERVRELQERILHLQKSLQQNWQHMVLKNQQVLAGISAQLKHVSPLKNITFHQHRLSIITHGMHYHLQQHMQLAKLQFNELATRLDSMSPLKTLSRGYAILYNQTHDKLISSVKTVAIDDVIIAQVADGTLHCTVKEKKE